MVAQSDHCGEELLSLALMKNGKKVVCGTESGTLVTWSVGRWGDISDRFPVRSPKRKYFVFLK
jgi:hypothetical protein